MDIGDIFDVNINDMNERGIGVTRIDGVVVFIPGLVTGDCAKIRIVSREKNYFTAEAEEITSPSADRIYPVCDNMSCGGCSLSHVSYELENAIKKNTVKNALRRSGLPHELVEDTLYSENRTGYRNKLTVHYSNKSGSFGLYADRTNDVLPYTSCAICPNIMSDIVRFTNENIELLPTDHVTSLIIRTDSEDKVTVSVYSDKLVKIEKYKAALTDRFGNVCSVVLIVQNSGGGFIHDRIMGVDMRFSSEAFRQVNSAVFEMLLAVVHNIASKSEFDCMADLYCGSGVIGLTLAKAFPKAKLYGIEINSDAVSDARYNAEANGIENIEFFCGDSASFKKRIGKKMLPQLIVVDPPRAGLSKEMRIGLTELSPANIIYVSCNPQTLARDLVSLRDSGYMIERVVPVNMFPMTSHCECVVSLKKEKALHKMKLQSAPYSMIKSGHKTIELRLFDEKRQKIKTGDQIVFTDTATAETLTATVAKLHRFNSFDELYKSLPLLRCGYTTENVDKASPADMELYYSAEMQKKYGVVGIELTDINQL